MEVYLFYDHKKKFYALIKINLLSEWVFHRLGMYGFQWNWQSSIYSWFHCCRSPEVQLNASKLSEW